MTKKKNKQVKVFKGLSYLIIKFLLNIIARFIFKYRNLAHYKIKKDESVVIVSNHQTDVDAVFINLAFNKILRTITTDNLFKKGFASWIIRKFGCFPKRKGAMDINSNMELLRFARHHEPILFFPEGNRTYGEFQYYISEGIGKTIKLLKSTLIIFNIHGGTGRYPRFGAKARRGKYYGEIVKVMPYEEYKDMDDLELSKFIIDSIRVFDSESGELYKSKRRAEYLERMFFVCPKCGKHSTLVSNKEKIRCTECGFEATMNENLTLSSEDPSFKFNRFIDWYNYQIRWVSDLKINAKEKLFVDDNIILRTSNPNEKSKTLYKGTMVLYEDKLTFGDLVFNVSDIAVASPVSGTKLLFTVDECGYEVKGHDRFNPLKYVFMFNKLETKMKVNKIDNYYPLKEYEYAPR